MRRLGQGVAKRVGQLVFKRIHGGRSPRSPGFESTRATSSSRPGRAGINKPIVAELTID
jgi:hypothetical protein